MKPLICRLVALPLLLLVSLGTVAQNQVSHWYFGDRAGVSFATGSPVALLNGQLGFPPSEFHNEGSAAISDGSGNLIFYTDGMTIWNRNHQVMLNGSGLRGNFSTTQSSLIIPSPSNPNERYYVFTLGSDFCCGGNPGDGLRYSVVDLCLDGNLGAVVANEKNVLLADTLAEKLAAARHSNGVDDWILCHRWESNEFWAFRLAGAGIVDTVVSAIGSMHQGWVAGAQGQMKFSHDGRQLVVASSNGLNLLELFDFDNSTGIISNYRSLAKPNNDQSAIYGAEFSPDNTKLYITGMGTMGIVHTFLAQYDLSAGGGNLAAINASLVELYHRPTGLMSHRGLQSGPDQKIYWVSLLDETQLGAIQTPNAAGVGCWMMDPAVSLGGRYGSYSLPGFVAGFDYSNGPMGCDIVGLEADDLQAWTWVPNPMQTAAVLRLPKTMTAPVELVLVDVQGQVVREMRSQSTDRLVLARGDLAAGLYGYRVVSEGKVLTAGRLLVE